VDDIAVFDLDRPGGHPHRIRSGVGFGDPQAADVLPAARLGENFHLLFLRRIPPEVVEAEGLARPHGHGQGVAHPGDGFIDEQGLHVAEAGPAVFFLKDDAVDADLAQLPEEIRGHPVLLIEILHLWFQPGGCPAPDDFLNHFLLQREFEIERHSHSLLGSMICC
jgi:hypothetical protein